LRLFEISSQKACDRSTKSGEVIRGISSGIRRHGVSNSKIALSHHRDKKNGELKRSLGAINPK